MVSRHSNEKGSAAKTCSDAACLEYDNGRGRERLYSSIRQKQKLWVVSTRVTIDLCAISASTRQLRRKRRRSLPTESPILPFPLAPRCAWGHFLRAMSVAASEVTCPSGGPSGPKLQEMFFAAAREHGQERDDLPVWALRPEITPSQAFPFASDHSHVRRQGCSGLEGWLSDSGLAVRSRVRGIRDSLGRAWIPYGRSCLTPLTPSAT